MSDPALLLWQIILWGLLGIGAILVTALWLFIAFAVLRTIAEFIKAFKEADNLDDDFEESGMY